MFRRLFVLVVLVCVVAVAVPAFAQADEPVLPVADAFQLFVQQLLQGVIAVAVPVLVVQIVRLLERAIGSIRARLTNEQYESLELVISTVVKAAEQSGLKGAIVNAGYDKKKWAIAEAQRILNERGWKQIDVQLLSTMIEAALRDGLHKGGVLLELEPAG